MPHVATHTPLCYAIDIMGSGRTTRVDAIAPVTGMPPGHAVVAERGDDAAAACDPPLHVGDPIVRVVMRTRQTCAEADLI